MDIFSLLKLLLGLAFFLFGMNVMSSNLEKMAGGKLEHMLKKMTSNPFISLLLGAGITIAIQSSSATTVMLVGLVNSGIMNFSQTLYVIFGANIGTTLTSWILSLSGIESTNLALQLLKPENFSPIFAFIGILMMMISKSDKKKSIGTIFIGFSILMYGMEFMAEAVSPIADMPWFSDLLAQCRNPIFGVLLGAAFTAIIQSSAASVGVLQALSMTGKLSYSMAIPIVMGQNIGTCITAIISCIGTNSNAKRVSVIHLSLNVIGTVICLIIYTATNAIFNFGFADMTVSPFSIALIHSIFNIAITIILAPFGKWILKLSEVVIRDDKVPVDEKALMFKIDERLFRSPSVAINECANLTVEMSKIANNALTSSISLLKNYDEETAKKVLEDEKNLDLLEDNLGTYLVKLSSQAISINDSQNVSKMLHNIGDFERLGDHAVNLLKTAKEIKSKNITFSNEANKELAVLTKAICEILSITMEAYEKNDVSLAGKVEPLEQVIDSLTAEIKNNHISRLQNGNCTIELGFVLSDLLTNYERISDHCSNIAVAIIELVHNSFDTHKYLAGVKFGNSEFSEIYSEFEMKYSL